MPGVRALAAQEMLQRGGRARFFVFPFYIPSHDCGAVRPPRSSSGLARIVKSEGSEEILHMSAHAATILSPPFPRGKEGEGHGSGARRTGRARARRERDPGPRLGVGDALLVVDVQADFCPGGALPVPEGDRVIRPLNLWLERARRAAIPVYASRDWHPPRHPSFVSEGGEWAPHCLQESLGAAYHPDLRLPTDALRIAKGTRLDRDQLSAFDETGLALDMRERGIERLWVGGLALDVSVQASVLEALREGFEVHLLTGATRATDTSRVRKSLREMLAAGVRLEDV